MAKTVEVTGRPAEHSDSFRVAKAKRRPVRPLGQVRFRWVFQQHIESVKKRGDSGARGRLGCFQLMEMVSEGSSP
jgi:hypothetical protein